MKSFIFLAAVACVAIILLAKSEAQRPDRCREKPPMNTTEDRCDRFQFCLRARQCRRTCVDCYNSTELNRRPPGCLVNRRCVCLGINGGDNGTTEAPTEAPTTQAPTEVPTTQAPTELPTTQAPTEAPTTVA